jgi:hypothetical protein
VDGRAKPGHDTMRTIMPPTCHFNAYADKPGHDGGATAAAGHSRDVCIP